MKPGCGAKPNEAGADAAKPDGAIAYDDDDDDGDDDDDDDDGIIGIGCCCVGGIDVGCAGSGCGCCCIG